MTWISLIWKMTSFIVFIIGLAGIPDNIKQWNEWLKGWFPMLFGYGPISWLLILVGGSISIYATYPLWIRLFQIKRGIGKS